MKKTSLNDIAVSLGVSKTLVSLVLNNKGNENGINAETQKKVIEKAKELNYQPNQMARGLRLGRSETIGLIIADISNQFFARIARKIEDRASKLGYQVIFCSSDENPEKELNLIRMLKDRQVDGLIVSSTLSDKKVFQELINQNYPIVLIDRYIKGLEIDQVISDNFKGAYELTSYLILKSYKKIAFFTISPSHLSTVYERLEGYKQALKDNNISYNPELVVEINFHEIKKDTYAAIDKISSGQIDAEAIFASNNAIARKCLRRLNTSSIIIPEEIALVSFDDIELFQYHSPAITAVKQKVSAMGETAVDLLMKKINQKDSKNEVEKIVLPTELIVRNSCK